MGTVYILQCVRTDCETDDRKIIRWCCFDNVYAADESAAYANRRYGNMTGEDGDQYEDWHVAHVPVKTYAAECLSDLDNWFSGEE